MIRRFENKDLDQVMSIWLQVNMESHFFIEADYWKNNYEMVREMTESGLIDIGSHTIHHVNLPTLSYEQQEEEIAHSKTIIEQAYNITCKSFAYPFGFYDDTSVALVQKHGYTSAVTTVPKFLPWEDKNRYEIPRVIISGRQSLFDFKLKMLKGRNR